MSLIDLGSKFFTWREVLRSDTAVRLGLDNTPDDETQATLAHTAKRMDAVREFLGHPIRPSSWYRSPKVNAATGGAIKPPSQHMKGEAVDFECPGFGSNDAVFEALRDRMEELDIDQLIREFPVAGDPDSGWIHVSFSDRRRRAALVIGKRAA